MSISADQDREGLCKLLLDGAASKPTASVDESYFSDLMLRRYPYIIFCVERDDHIDVWRVLHAHRDIAVWMREAESR